MESNNFIISTSYKVKNVYSYKIFLSNKMIFILQCTSFDNYNIIILNSKDLKHFKTIKTGSIGLFSLVSYGLKIYMAISGSIYLFSPKTL
jgi:hypothetical protein